MRNREGFGASPRLLYEARMTNKLFIERRGSNHPEMDDYNDLLDPILAALFTTSSSVTRRNLGFKQTVIDKWIFQMSKGQVPNRCGSMDEFNYKLLIFLAEHEHARSPFVQDAKARVEKIDAEKQSKKL